MKTQILSVRPRLDYIESYSEDAGILWVMGEWLNKMGFVSMQHKRVVRVKATGVRV